MSIDEAIQFGRTDQSTPRELASVIARKFRMVVSVTSKSFEPDVPRPSYQVHRIETEFGKQSRSSALGRRPGLALASSSSSSASDLSPLANTLVEELINDQPGSSGTGTNLSDVLTTDPTAGSVADVEPPLLNTPPSVTKPDFVHTNKPVVLSNVKRALQYEDSSPRGSSEAILELAPQVQRGESGLLLVRDEDNMLACRTIPHVPSEKPLSAPDGNLASPDVLSEKLMLPTVDDLTAAPVPTTVPTPEKNAGSKRRQLAHKPDAPGRKKKST